MNKRALVTAFLLLLLAFSFTSVEAKVTRVEVSSRSDVLGGKEFGPAGAYEKITGKVYFSVDPRSPHNGVIVDLDKAPRNAAGEVEFSADLYVLRPKDPRRAAGSMLLEIPNRGGKGIIRLINRATAGSVDPKTEAEFGDGFLMRQGLTLVWVGWQFDVRDEAGLMRLHAPVAREGGRAIEGLVRSDFVVHEKTDDHPLGHMISGQIGGTEYAASDPESASNVLTVRDSPYGERKLIPRGEWGFGRRAADGTVSGSDRFIHLKGGFEPGRIYEVVYVAKDPAVVGLGLAAVRDVTSYFKHDPSAVAPVKRAYALGISQSGRFLRHFLRQGFNADERGRQVFDGMLIHVAGAGVGSFNHRFAQPSRDAQPTTALLYPTDLFPFSDAPQTDPRTGQTAGLLDRAKSESVLPKIFHTNTSYEYWSRAASLVHTSVDGGRDLPLPDNVRVYLLTGLQHFSGPFPPERGTNPVLLGRHPQNPNPVWWLWRALVLNIDAWVREGVEPPPSRYPKLADGTLVPLGALKFPSIPGVGLPESAHQAFRMDYGPTWGGGIITRQPPAVGQAFPVFVPQVDADGNEVAGVRPPQLSVPLATYTGWNLRDPKTGMPRERVSFIGSYLPFAKTRAERESAKDPRASIAERYRSREEYLGKYAEAALGLVEGRFLLPADLSEVLARARQEWEVANR